ncbi:MAG: preprotein translocase subunit Sec61beta [Nanoarchaeota archaeon]
MAQQQNTSLPGPFGGLVRYDSEYGSRFKLTPTQVLVFAVLIVVMVLAFNIFWKVA